MVVLVIQNSFISVGQSWYSGIKTNNSYLITIVKDVYKLWYIYTMEYYSAVKKNSFGSVLMRWMKPEPIIQSEVSQKDKEHYSILTHIYGI